MFDISTFDRRPTEQVPCPTAVQQEDVAVAPLTLNEMPEDPKLIPTADVEEEPSSES